MVITRVGPLSCAKIAGTLYAAIGLVLGIFFSIAAMIGGLVSQTSESTGFGAGIGVLMGAGAIVVLPLLYGGMGFLVTLLGAWLYNVLAGTVGGIEIDVTERRAEG